LVKFKPGKFALQSRELLNYIIYKVLFIIKRDLRGIYLKDFFKGFFFSKYDLIKKINKKPLLKDFKNSFSFVFFIYNIYNKVYNSATLQKKLATF